MGNFSLFHFGKNKKDESQLSRDDGTFIADKIDRKKQAPRGMPNGAADPQLAEKKRARRRLIGSIILVALAVGLLPVVFESQPQQKNGDINVEMQGESLSNASIANNNTQEQVVSPDQTTPESTAQSSSEQAPETIAQDETATQSTQTPVPAQESTSKASDNKAYEEKQRADIAEKERKSREEKAREEKARADKAEKERQEKLDREKQKKKVDSDPIGRMIADKGNGGKTAQIAAMSTQDKANEVQSRLSRNGVRASVQKISQGGETRYRVRIGPYANRSETERACAKVRSAGMSCSIVN